MRYTIENEFIRLTVDSLGAEMVSAVDLATGSEMIWCADPAVWNRHAPILFPYAGKLTGGHFKAEDGKIYAGGQHGFARDMEHALLNLLARRPPRPPRRQRPQHGQGDPAFRTGLPPRLHPAV